MITRYVNTASSAGGDGTTNGTAGSTRAFATLREALDSFSSPLSDAITVYCEGTAADTLNITQTHWDFQTSSTNYLRIIGEQSPSHPNFSTAKSGKYDTSLYRIEVTNAGAIYNNDAGHVRIEGLQVQITVTTSGGSAYTCFRLATANNLNGPIDHRFGYCIAKMVVSGGTDNTLGFVNSDPTSGGTCKIYNCLAYGGYCGFNSDGTSWATNNLYNYNCTAWGNEFNWLDAQICKNCLSANPTTGDGFGFLSTGSTGHTNNASDESSAVGTNARVNQTFSFVDVAGRDFHLLATDAGARTFGVSDPGSGLFSDDIDGQARGATWDIGYDQYVAPVIQNLGCVEISDRSRRARIFAPGLGR